MPKKLSKYQQVKNCIDYWVTEKIEFKDELLICKAHQKAYHRKNRGGK